MNSARSRTMTSRTMDTSRDKKERLKVFLINKLKDRNGIVNEDGPTHKILNEEATRLLTKPASEAELRKAEKRLMKRLMDKVGPTAIGGRTTQRGVGHPPATGRSSARGAMVTGRSAISNATSVLDEFGGGHELQNIGRRATDDAAAERQGARRLRLLAPLHGDGREELSARGEEAQFYNTDALSWPRMRGLAQTLIHKKMYSVNPI